MEEKKMEEKKTTVTERRNFLRGAGMVAGGAALGGVMARSPTTVTEIAQELTVKPANAASTSKLGEIYSQFGKNILLLPGKFTGTVSATDLSSGMTVAWMAMWNYGDDCPITHHLAAFPSPDPYKGFEFIMDTQGWKNLYIYGIPTKVENPGQGFKIYKIRYDGTKMNLVSEISEKTGVGLGVHVTVTPNADGFAVGDGQKDIFAEFDRESENVRSAWFFDWEPNNKELSKAWTDGGLLTIKRLKPGANGKFDYFGTKGIKIDWELVPGGELFAEQGKVSGARLINNVALDAFVFDPRGKWGTVALRTIGLAIVFNRETWEPVAALPGPKGDPDQVPMNKVDGDTWTIKLDKVTSPAHQAGFSPDGKHFLFMNGVRQNNIMVWDTSNHADPTKWKKKAVVEHPDWRGSYPNTFHMVFTPDAKKVYVTLWWPSPTPNGVAVVDAVNWKVLKQIDIGPDLHTLSVNHEGTHVFGVISGYQKTASGIFVIDTRTDELVGMMPSAQGHHDCVIVPRDVVDLRTSRSTTT